MTTRDPHTAELALSEAVNWGNHAGTLLGKGTPDDIVGAAQAFEKFLTDEPALLDEFIIPEWANPKWRIRFVEQICEQVYNWMTWEGFAESIGELVDPADVDRTVVKGVYGSTVHWLSSDTAGAPVINRTRIDESVWEMGRPYEVEFCCTVPVEELTEHVRNDDLATWVSNQASAAAAYFNSTIRLALRNVLESAGFSDPVAADDRSDFDAYPCPPFRVVTARYGMKAKEWESEGDDQWHLRLRVPVNAAAFVPGKET